jgi:DNA-directed RNA polymerase subunit H (RpoH/RPB5)
VNCFEHVLQRQQKPITQQALPGLRPADDVAQSLGQKLGRGALLL